MSDANRQWYYSVGGINQGPLSPDQMRALVASGKIAGDTLVWSAPMPEWVPLATSELAAPVAIPQGARPTAGAAAGRASQPQGPITQITVGGTAIPIPGFVQQMASPDFLLAVQTCLQKYADFNGRAGRPEFWWFYLFSVIVSLTTMILDWIVSSVIGLSIFQAIAVLALIVPQLAAGARRLHDTGRSGWLQLLSLTLIGIIPLIYWLAQPGEAGQNKYGNPSA